MNQLNQYLYGLHTVSRLLTSNHNTILEIIVISEQQNKRIKNIVALAKKKNILCQVLPKIDLDKLTQGEAHQGIVAKCQISKQLVEKDLEDIIKKQEQNGESSLFLILDEIQDPHNFGACIRSANAMGVTAIIVPKRNSSPLTAVARKSASGAAEITPIVWITNLARTLRYLKKNNVWIVGTSDDAKQSIYQAELTDSIAIVVGNEGVGMRRLTQESCDFLVKIPMHGTVESLNVSVATGIILSEAMRQRVLEIS